MTYMTKHSLGLCYKKTVECFTAAVGQCTRDIGDGTQAIEKLNGFEGADLIERLKHLIVAIGAFNKTVLPNLISVKAANAALAQLCEALQGLHVAVDNTIVGKFVTCLKDELRKLPLEVDALFAYRDVLQSIVGGFVQKDPHDEMLERFESWTSATKNETPEDLSLIHI